MQDRVSSSLVTSAMDSLLERSGCKVPNRLHRLIADRTGLHPTTVLRYHRGQLESADARVLECVRELEACLERGETLFADDDGEPGRFASMDGHGLVSIHQLQRWYERVLALLENPSPHVLHSYIERETGIPAQSIAEWYGGERTGVPAAIVEALRELDRRLTTGEVVVFRNASGPASWIVPRRTVLSLVEEIRTLGIIPAAGPRFCLEIESMLELEPGTIRQLMQKKSWPFASHEVLEKLVALRESATYDPRRHYEIGDLLFHHEFGTGTVVAKRHKSRMLIEFRGGARRYLCEDINVDPRWPYPFASDTDPALVPPSSMH